MNKADFAEGYHWGVKYALTRKVGYMDKIDFDYELGLALGGSQIFPSEQDLRENTKHDLTECGIVKVEVTLLEVIQEEDYSKYTKTDTTDDIR